MVRFPRVGSAFALALDEAGRSPLIEGPIPSRPWLRLLGFGLLSAGILACVIMVVRVLVTAIPSFGDLLRTDGIPDTPRRLFPESGYAIGLGLVLALAALAIVQGAMIAYRRSLIDFLWPGRRFERLDFAVGALMVAALWVITIPFYLWTGIVWDPPLLDPLYRHDSRIVYLVGLTIGLLTAAAAEEVVCRGVLLRILGVAMRRPLLLCAVNGILFSAIHLDPDPVAFVARTLSGAVWTWAALRLGGVEFAIGAHLANNLMIGLFGAPLSEAEVGQNSHWTLLLPELLTAAVSVIFIERLVCRRRSAVAEQANP